MTTPTNSASPVEAGGGEAAPFWISWWADPKVAYTLHSPWWRSGYRYHDALGDDEWEQASICAAVVAASEEAAKAAIIAAHDTPVELEWRFVERKPADWSPYSSRFQPADWMRWQSTIATVPALGGAA